MPHSTEGSPSDLALVGRHFLIGLQKSPILTEHDKVLLSALRPAGIVLFRDNFRRDVGYDEWLATLQKLIDGVRACVERETLLVTIDHEGGAVFRPPSPMTNFGSAANWARKSSEVGAAMGVELRSLGINVNYAPVVDIHTNPSNPVIGRRAFGSEPGTVIVSAQNFLRALELEGVLGCPKHFPGHGDTNIDSHYALPVVARTLDELRQREFAPFAAMAQAGAKIMMSAHICYPRIDPERPATLSRLFLNEVLRREMGFTGVITTDDIGMAAVSDLFDRPGTAVDTLNAGCDLILLSAHWTDTNRALKIAEDLLAGLKTGELNAARFGASQERIDKLLQTAIAHPIERLSAEVFAKHAALKTAIEDIA